MKAILKSIAQKLGVKILKTDSPMRSLDAGLQKLAGVIPPRRM